MELSLNEIVRINNGGSIFEAEIVKITEDRFGNKFYITKQTYGRNKEHTSFLLINQSWITKEPINFFQ